MELMDRSDVYCVTGTVPQGPLDWDAINWRQVERSVRGLQVRIAKAMRVTVIAGSREGALKGLSRMTGNCHVRFLGGRVDE